MHEGTHESTHEGPHEGAHEGTHESTDLTKTRTKVITAASVQVLDVDWIHIKGRINGYERNDQRTNREYEMGESQTAMSAYHHNARHSSTQQPPTTKEYRNSSTQQPPTTKEYRNNGYNPPRSARDAYDDHEIAAAAIEIMRENGGEMDQDYEAHEYSF